MNCTCENKRVITIVGKCGDMCGSFCEELNAKQEGYPPYIKNVSGGDYIDFSFCAICGQIQDFSPMTDEQIEGAIGGY